jgi:hypothetical protein
MKQLNLLDESGAPHADIHCGMTPDKSDPNRFALTGMSFVIMPENKRDGISIALTALRILHRDPSRPWAYADWIDEPIAVEYWAATVFIVFRKDNRDDDGTIRLTRLKDQFHMSLPSVDSWSDAGLSWVYSNTRCRKEKQNATPWLGRICDCDCPVTAPKFPPKRTPQWE